MFIKLTRANFYIPPYIQGHIGTIEEWEEEMHLDSELLKESVITRKEDCDTTIVLQNRDSYSVKETPEEIFKLIKQGEKEND